MKPEERRKKMEKEGWRIHEIYPHLKRSIMVRIGLNQEPEYATIFHNGKLRYGNHSPANCFIKSGYEYPAYN